MTSTTIKLTIPLEGMDLTSYWMPPLLNFKPGIRSQEISEMVRQSPANPTSQWLASLRKTAYQNGLHIYGVGSPVKMAQPTRELRQKEITFAKKWIDIADHLGAGHVRVFAGAIPKGGTEAQAVDWAIEVYKSALDYAGTKGILLGPEDDDELTRTSDQLLAILKKTDHPFARINLDCGNFRKDGYKEVERCAPFAAATHTSKRIWRRQTVSEKQPTGSNCSVYSRMPPTEVTFRWSSSLMIKTTNCEVTRLN